MKRREPVAVAVMLALVAVVASSRGCGPASTSQPTTLPTTQMQLGQKTFVLEIAGNEADRERGLMHRDAMPADHGMIFVFPDSKPRAFWMRNTRIPLDILYINPKFEIVSIHTMKPYDIKSTPSAGPAMYAIELNAGVAGELHLKPGDKVAIPAEAQQTRE